MASALEANARLLAAPLIFVSADKRLLDAATAEGLSTDDPTRTPKSIQGAKPQNGNCTVYRRYFPLILAALLGIYMRFIRPWQLHWGAADSEIGRSMAGDDVVKSPTFNATRALTIAARPEHIFPWIRQIGVTRAGWYSIDLFDNLGRPSAEVILPQFQHSHIGDVVPMSPDGKSGMFIKDFVANQSMLWGDKSGDMTWAWGLYPLDETHTRLITRVRMKYHWFSPTIVFELLVEFTDVVMMLKCMSGIRRRAEHLARGSVSA